MIRLCHSRTSFIIYSYHSLFLNPIMIIISIICSIILLFLLHSYRFIEAKEYSSSICTMADPTSYSNFDKAVIRSTHMDWKVDMGEKIISGSVTHQIEGIVDTNILKLDGRSLTVSNVEWNGVMTPFNYSKVSDALGDVLTVQLDSILSEGMKGSLKVYYNTSPSALALQFLSSNQTSDKKGPFLFSQCQAIHARSMLPCQDTPAVKAPYSAKVSVPAKLTCLMSAVSVNSDTSGSNEWIYSFSQDIPIPSYLIAIVVGVLESRPIGPRSILWAEKSIVDSAAEEFNETETFLQAAEDIAGPYVWKRYDMVVLPASFPYGGMENPCLTFITPTIIAGDKSLVSVIAHEISHSWTGNLVTTANWNHFWLNEGFTVYLERLINGKVYGNDRRDFNAQGGFNSLGRVIKDVLPQHSKLRLSNRGEDPDDAFSLVPYEKGSALLMYIEEEVLNEEEKISFLKEHVRLFSSKSLDTETWLKSMYERYPKMKKIEGIVNEWIYGEGMPPAKPLFKDDSMTIQCYDVLNNLLSDNPSSDKFTHLSASQKIFVMNDLSERAPIDHSKLNILSQSEFGITSSGNSELVSVWLKTGLLSKWEPSILPSLQFAKKYGRLKFCKTTYQKLFNWDLSRQRAIDQFEKEKMNMHPITVAQIESLLKKK